MPVYRKDPKTGKFAARKPQNRPTKFDTPQARQDRHSDVHPSLRADARAASLYHEDNVVPKDKDEQAEHKIAQRQSQREIEEARLALDPDAEKAAAWYPNLSNRRIAPSTVTSGDPRTPEVKPETA